MWDLPNNKTLQEIIRKLYEDRGEIVAAVCHGPGGLINVKLSNGKYLVEGKEVTCFSNEEERSMGLEKVVPFLLEDAMKERGAVVKTGKPWEECVRRSERLLTGQNPVSAGPLATEMVIAIGRNQGKKPTQTQ